MKILTVIGNRPQFVKAAAVSRRLRERHQEVVAHSGQHYDDELSAVFFEELDLPELDHWLGVGSGSHAAQTAAVMIALEPLVASEQPDLVLVYGDTNTTLAGALTAAKLGAPVGHVEAGARSFDRSMPEELNRVVTDHCSELLLCSTPAHVENLRREGIEQGVHLVGDVMADVSLRSGALADQRSQILARFGLEPGAYLVVTAHRAGNVDDPAQLERLAAVLRSLPGPAIFPVHPRTRRRLEEDGQLGALESEPGLVLCEPLGYLDFLRLLRGARAVVTDSGGVQKEAYLQSVPCVTLRDTSEWMETVEAGWNRLTDLDPTAVAAALEQAPPQQHPDLYGGGQAGERVAAAVESFAGQNDTARR